MAGPYAYILGGAQTDFAVNVSRKGGGLFELLEAATRGALADAELAPSQIAAAHVGSFTCERFSHQGHLGGLLVAVEPGFAGLPTSRHEAACASGSMAVLAALAELAAGFYDCILVVGVEEMRNVDGKLAADHLAAAAYYGREATAARYLWPYLFSQLADEYDRRYGLDERHLRRIAELNFRNARQNPLAQTRGWTLTPAHFSDDDTVNPIVEGRLRRHDCSQITDGAAAVILASPRFAHEHCARTGRSLAGLPKIEGFGHRTATLLYEPKVAESRGAPFVFPHLRGAYLDALRRAGLGTGDSLEAPLPPETLAAIDAFEVHDCFTITEYMAIDHLGLTPPGRSFEAIESGAIEKDGTSPVNASGGLIGLGHPVGATGVRMVLDAARQVAGRAGGCQVEGARRVVTLNIGGSATTTACFVVGRD